MANTKKGCLITILKLMWNQLWLFLGTVFSGVGLAKRPLQSKENLELPSFSDTNN